MIKNINGNTENVNGMTENIPGLISFVIPVKDEEESLRELYQRIAAEMGKLARPFEVIFIDDGSVDGSWRIISELAAENDEIVTAHRFRRNVGKADVLATGFQTARGQIVFTMDADLQDDPKEIPRFIEKLNEGFDLVSGWKKRRHDPWHKVLPSRVFNFMVSSALNVALHDHNCGFKCYRSEVVKDVSIYGELHRMIPSLASIKGYRSTEIEVEHHARKYGKSKYGAKRFFRGFVDMQTVYFLKNFRERPLHFFGGMGAFCAISGVGFFALGLLPWVSTIVANRATSIAEIFLVAALPLFAIGFLAELIVRGNVETHRRPPIAEMIPRRDREYQTAVNEKAMSSRETARESSTNHNGARNGSAEKILVVDEEPNARRMVRQRLESAGYAVETAADAAEAISKMSDGTSVVLIDLKLGSRNNDGLDFLGHVRKHQADVKIIILSGQSVKLGEFDHFPTPLDPDPLLNLVDKAVNIRKMALD